MAEQLEAPLVSLGWGNIQNIVYRLNILYTDSDLLLWTRIGK